MCAHPPFAMSRLLCTALALALASPLAAQDAGPDADLDADLDAVLALVTGRFDNNLQVWQQGEDGVDDSLRHQHVSAVFAPASVPAVGERVVWARQTPAANLDAEPRHRLYAFSRAAGGSPDVTMPSYAVARLDALDDSVSRAGLTLGDLRTEGCVVRWTPDGDAFRGTVQGDDCARPDSGGTGWLLSAGEIQLPGAGGAPDALRRADGFSG